MTPAFLSHFIPQPTVCAPTLSPPAAACTGVASRRSRDDYVGTTLQRFHRGWHKTRMEYARLAGNINRVATGGKLGRMPSEIAVIRKPRIAEYPPSSGTWYSGAEFC